MNRKKLYDIKNQIVVKPVASRNCRLTNRVHELTKGKFCTCRNTQNVVQNFSATSFWSLFAEKKVTVRPTRGHLGNSLSRTRYVVRDYLKTQPLRLFERNIIQWRNLKT